MAITLIGNHRAGFGGHSPNGIGGNAMPLHLGYLSGAGKAGDIIVIPMSDIINGGINMGVFVQAPGRYTLNFTLSNPGNINRTTGAGGIWGANQVVPTGGAIVQTATPIFTAMKVTLTDDGEFYVIAR